ncbi:MAG: ATP-binding protein [Candidatus Omnitrophica bacterium]|nr:ATP-binding protein [Candidatus Omnitrophota bacterium]
MSQGCSAPDIAIEIAPNARNLSLVRHFIGSLAYDLRFSSEEALQLEMCVDEACANSIEGMNKRDGEHGDSCVRIELIIKQDAIHIVIIDCGRDFSQALKKASPLHDFSDRTRKRGYGLQIIKTFMDVVDYVHDPQTGNRLQLVKYFSHVRR